MNVPFNSQGVIVSFRIAIGRCDCRKPYRDRIQERVCKRIAARIADWEDRLPKELGAVPKESFQDEKIEGSRVTFGTYKLALDGGETLVVFQALVHTWSKPTFFSVGGIGRIYAEGLLVAADGTVDAAPDKLLWQFR